MWSILKKLGSVSRRANTGGGVPPNVGNLAFFLLTNINKMPVLAENFRLPPKNKFSLRPKFSLPNTKKSLYHSKNFLPPLLMLDPTCAPVRLSEISQNKNTWLISVFIITESYLIKSIFPLKYIIDKYTSLCSQSVIVVLSLFLNIHFPLQQI